MAGDAEVTSGTRAKGGSQAAPATGTVLPTATASAPVAQAVPAVSGAEAPATAASAAPKVCVEHVSKAFEGREGERLALDDVSLDIAENEFVSVVGPSGCGKSTLLSLIAGLERPTSGRVLVDGEPVEGPGPERGVVFQQYALFPWLTVEGNVEFGLKLAGVDAARRRERAAGLLEAVGLADFANAYPKELSGGMRQRVAIARAWAPDPAVLLMDEPFGALDAQTRVQLQQELLDMWVASRTTCFFITHDVEEAVLLAQRVVVMSPRPGHVQQVIDVDIPYPRGPETRLDAHFLEIKARVWELVYRELMAAPA